MTGQFEWYDDHPKPRTAPKYTDFEVWRGQHPIRTADGQLLTCKAVSEGKRRKKRIAERIYR